MWATLNMIDSLWQRLVVYLPNHPGKRGWQPGLGNAQPSLGQERTRHAIEESVAWQYPGQTHNANGGKDLGLAAANLYVPSTPNDPGSAWR